MVRLLWTQAPGPQNGHPVLSMATRGFAAPNHDSAGLTYENPIGLAGRFEDQWGKETELPRRNQYKNADSFKGI